LIRFRTQFDPMRLYILIGLRTQFDPMRLYILIGLSEIMVP